MPMTRWIVEMIVDQDDSVDEREISEAIKRELEGTTLVVDRRKTLAMLDEIESVDCRGPA